jgi:transposase
MSKDWRTERRRSAVAMSETGMTQREIASVLNVSAMAVNKWLRAHRDGGSSGLCSRSHLGAKARLSADQLRLIPDCLSHGAEAYGFRGQVWTCRRVASVIKQEFNVTYSASHVSRLLKALKWTPQRPVERASQRDEHTIADWRTRVWPDLKKRRLWNDANCFLWMKVAFTCCRAVCARMHQSARHRYCPSSRHTITCLS